MTHPRQAIAKRDLGQAVVAMNPRHAIATTDLGHAIVATNPRHAIAATDLGRVIVAEGPRQALSRVALVGLNGRSRTGWHRARGQRSGKSASWRIGSNDCRSTGLPLRKSDTCSRRPIR